MNMLGFWGIDEKRLEDDPVLASMVDDINIDAKTLFGSCVQLYFYMQNVGCDQERFKKFLEDVLGGFTLSFPGVNLNEIIYYINECAGNFRKII